MEDKNKRRVIRVPLLSESLAINDAVTGLQRVEMKDISPYGAFLATSIPVKPRQVIDLEFHLPNSLGIIPVKATVIRVNWTINKKKHKDTIGFGCQFINVSENNQRILDAYVVYLRNKQIITVSKRIIEEFMGPRPGL